jgi:hypothetical protein
MGFPESRAKVCLDYLLVVLDKVGITFGDLAAMIENDDMIRDSHNQFHVMFYKKYGFFVRVHGVRWRAQPLEIT